MLKSKESKRAVILKAALKLFAQNGFHSAPVSKLAPLAGIGVGSIYRYFKNKEDLIHCVYQDVDQSLQKAITASYSTSLSDRDQYIQLIKNLVLYLHSHPREFKFLEQYYCSPYGIKKKRGKFSKGENEGDSSLFIHLFCGEKEATIKKLPLPVYQALTFGPVIYFLRDSMSGFVTLDESIVQTLAESCWNAIKA